MSCNNCKTCKCELPEYVSITKVIAETKPWKDKQALEDWKLRVGEEEATKISEEAKERGRRLDKDFEQLHTTGSCENIALSNFMTDYKIKEREQEVKSEILGIKGRLDAVLTDSEGNHIIIDFKTSKRLKKTEYIEDYFLQVAAYYFIYDLESYGVINSAKIVIFIGDQFTPQVFSLNKSQLEGFALKFFDRLTQYNKQKQKNKS